VPEHSRLFGQGGRYRCDYNRFFQGFRFSSLCSAAYETASSGVELRVVVWVREFLVIHTQRVRVGEQLSKEVKVTSGVPRGSIWGLLLFLVYINDIWRNIDSNIRLFAYNCIIYRKITNKNDRNIAEGSGHLGGVGGRK